MKIALFDTNQRKFTADMIQHWKGQGHEVKWAGTFRRPISEWADLLWFDCCDNNAICATKRVPELVKGKKVIIRAIDIDVWANHWRGIDFEKVHHLIFIAPHIRDYLLGEKQMPKSLKVHTIRCGVNSGKFIFRKDPTRTNDVAVVMSLWHGKGLDLLLQVIAALPEFRFHVCGRWGLNGIERGWYRRYVDQFLAHHSNWTHVESVPDMNEWLEDKSFALLCSKKECLSYFIAESMCKGLKPVIHDFYGARDIWPSKYIWRTVSEATKMMRSSNYDPPSYRRCVTMMYPLDKMLGAFDEIIAD